MENNEYIVYILKCSDGTLYTGITNNLTARLEKHRIGKGAKYVRSRLPFKLVYTEQSINRSTASIREAEIKRFSKPQKLKLINSN